VVGLRLCGRPDFPNLVGFDQNGASREQISGTRIQRSAGFDQSVRNRLGAQLCR
jgi:hypothetical protein